MLKMLFSARRVQHGLSFSSWKSSRALKFDKRWLSWEVWSKPSNWCWNKLWFKFKSSGFSLRRGGHAIFDGKSAVFSLSSSFSYEKWVANHL